MVALIGHTIITTFIKLFKLLHTLYSDTFLSAFLIDTDHYRHHKWGSPEDAPNQSSSIK